MTPDAEIKEKILKEIQKTANRGKYDGWTYDTEDIEKAISLALAEKEKEIEKLRKKVEGMK